MVIADETDAAAHAKVGALQGGRGHGGAAWLTDAGRRRHKSGADTNVRQMADPTSAVNLNMGTLVGSYASVARDAGRGGRPCPGLAGCC